MKAQPTSVSVILKAIIESNSYICNLKLVKEKVGKNVRSCDVICGAYQR